MRDTQWIEKVHDSSCGCKEWGDMGYAESLIVVFSFVLCNILYGIVEWFSFIHGYRLLGTLDYFILVPWIL